MASERITMPGPDQPGLYQIVLQGQISSQWSDWFDGFTLSLDERGQTSLVGLVADQAALYGLLKKIRDLGIPLISIIRLDPSEEATGK